MSNDDLQLFIARTQAYLTFVLFGGFLFLIFALLWLADVTIKNSTIDSQILTIVDRIINSMEIILAGAGGFWFGRYRPGQEKDGQISPLATPPPEKKI